MRAQWSATYDSGPQARPAVPPPGRGPGESATSERLSLVEGCLAGDHVALRDAWTVRVLRLTDGGTVWTKPSQSPISAIEVVADMVVVAADRVTAYAIGNGAVRWQSDLRGARTRADRRRSGHRHDDRRDHVRAGRHRRPAVAGCHCPRPCRARCRTGLTTDEHHAYLTFRPGRDQRSPPDVDVIAVRLD